MSAEDESAVEPPHLSIAERLQRRHGADLDPKIQLEAADARPATAASASASANSAQPSRVLTRLGTRGPMASRYRIEGEVARGGMGAILEVYDEDLRRKLAMKVMLEDLGESSGSARIKTDPAKLARFLEEAQVTGQLDHPGIVPVHELGLDRAGQVYFTMRLVRGRDMGAIFRLVPSGAEGWNTTRAVGLLLKVCEAMAYAHSKGVVHRDLKPANVMVGEFGEVYVMDWGLARVRNHVDLHDPRPRRDGEAFVDVVNTDRREGSAGPDSENLYTLDGDVMGTPSYMSPEQARGRLSDIGQASDVYSVGAMLYRLLARVAPYASKDADVHPGTVLERLYAGPPARVEALAPGAPAELAAICDKAMARDIARRYPNMLALAEDLRAFLEGRVVGAFETGAWAETRKWVRRNKSLAASLAAAVLALAAGLVASFVLQQRASANAVLAEERRIAAEASAESARRQARIAEEVNAFLNDDLLASVGVEYQGADVKVLEVLNQASLHLGAQFAGEPEVESALRHTIGSSYMSLGSYENALEHFDHALELRQASAGDDAEPSFHTEIARANVLRYLGRFDEALDAFDDIVARAEAALGAEAEATLTAMNDRGIALEDAGRLDEAREANEEVLEIERRVFGERHEMTLTTTNNLALIYAEQGRLAEAEERYRHVFNIRAALQGEGHPDTLYVMANLSSVLDKLGRRAEAEEMSRKCLELMQEVYGPEHPLMATAQGNLGVVLYSARRFAQAEEHFAESHRIALARYGSEHPLTLQARGHLAGARLELGGGADALEECVAVLELERRALGPRHARTLESLNRLACAYLKVARFDEAEPLFRELLALDREVLGDEHPTTLIAMENLSNVLFSKGDAGAAGQLLGEVLAARRRVLGASHPDVAKTLHNLGVVLGVQGDAEGSLAMLEEALAILRAAGDGPDPLKADCLKLIGDRRSNADQRESAIEAYREALDILRELGPEDAQAAYVRHQIGACQFALQDYASALETLREALTLREEALGRDALGTRITLHTLVRTLSKLARFAEAEPLALELHERTVRAAIPGDELLERVRASLAEIYDGLGRPEDALEWR